MFRPAVKVWILICALYLVGYDSKAEKPGGIEDGKDFKSNMSGDSREAEKQGGIEEAEEGKKPTSLNEDGKAKAKYLNSEPKDKDPKKLNLSELKDKFKEDDKEKEHWKDKKVDRENKKGKRLALGQQMKNEDLSDPSQLAVAVRFLYDDQDFVKKANPDDLFQSAKHFKDLDLKPRDAAGLYRKIAQANNFPDLDKFTKQDIENLRGVMSGMGHKKLRELPDNVVKESLGDLKEVPFTKVQARELVKKIVKDPPTAEDLKSMGNLAKGLSPKDIKGMAATAVRDALEDLAKAGLDQGQKLAFVRKALSDNDKKSKSSTVSKLMKMENFREDVTVASIKDDLSDEDVKASVTSTTGEWPLAQATALVKKYKKTKGDKSITKEELKSFGNLVSGVHPKDLKEMVSKGTDVSELAKTLSSKSHAMTSAQIDEVVHMVEKKEMVEDKEKVVDAAFVEKYGKFLAFMPPGQFKKLKFDADASKKFQEMCAAMDTTKLPLGRIKLLTERLMAMKQQDDPNMSADEKDYKKIQNLGEFIMGLEKEDIENFNPKAVEDSLPLLGSLPLDKDKSKAVVNKLSDSTADWKCNESSLALVGPLLQFSDKKEIDSLCDKAMAGAASVITKGLEDSAEVVETRKEEGTWIELGAVEDTSGREALVEKALDAVVAVASENGRSRRQASDKPLMCSDLQAVGSTVSDVEVNRITSMDNDEFLSCVELLGDDNRWTKSELNSLATKLEQAAGDPNSYQPDFMLEPGVLWAGFPSGKFSVMPIKDENILFSMGEHGRLSHEQLQKGYQRWLQQKENPNNVGEEFASISEFVCGPTVQEIAKLTAEVIRYAAGTIGKSRSCTPAQLKEYAKKFVTLNGDISSWDPSEVAEAGIVIGGLEPPDVRKMTEEQIQVITPATIKDLPNSFLKEMTAKLLGKMSTNQAYAMTGEQIAALSNEQKEAVEAVKAGRNPDYLSRASHAATIFQTRSLSCQLPSFVVLLFFHLM